MSAEEVSASTRAASASMADETARTRAGSSSCQDPAIVSTSYSMEEGDIMKLREKFPFLKDFSDKFIRSTPYEALLKTETTAIKLQDHERNKAVSLRLSSNRDKLAKIIIKVKGGEDNRWDILNEARFLPGAGCTAAKIWLRAREVMGATGHAAISTYDMNSIGLGGYVSKRGWVELHDIGSDSLSLKLFNINGCGNKVSGGVTNSDPEMREIAELGEFKLALRVAREALSMVFPWNKSISAIEGFMFQSNFCNEQLQGTDKAAVTLTQFVDYAFGENADRWRAHEPFLSTGDLRSAWASFYGAKPESSLQKSKQNNTKGSTQNTQSSNNNLKSNNRPGFHIFPGYFDDLCRMYNMGRCVKPPGTCATRAGVQLRHLCNFRKDMTKPADFCGKTHPACFNH